jgi:hypothetical protein
MSSSLTAEFDVHFTQAHRGRRLLQNGEQPVRDVLPSGRVPRIARLMALAVHFERLVAAADIQDYAQLASLGHVTRARATQIMNLLNLAPDIQEAILFLPPTESGRDTIKEWQLRPIATIVDWRRQRKLWKKLQPQSV